LKKLATLCALVRGKSVCPLAELLWKKFKQISSEVESAVDGA
jgi:hypothetical protein